jgi:hypothetical protein
MTMTSLAESCRLVKVPQAIPTKQFTDIILGHQP